jgi:HK97 family phage portal protein
MGFLNIFKPRHIKESRTQIINTKMGSAHWTPDNYEQFIAETYLKNRICFRAMFMIAQSISNVTWKLFKWNNDKIDKVEDHEIMNLLKKANPHETFNAVLFKWVIYLLASGNSFLERVMIGNEKYPRELYTLRPDKMQINTNPNTGGLDSYTFDKAIPFKIDPVSGDSDVLHSKLPNPLDDFWGASPIKALMREIDTSNEAIEWQKKILENEGRPGLVFTVDGTLSDQQYDRLENLLKDKHSGANGAGSNLIVENGAKVVPYNWTPKELDFMESNRELARGISSGWGVPPQMLGIIGDSTYCLPSYAKVATSKGLRSISELSVGDYVYSLVGNRLEERKVLEQMKTGHKVLYEIIAENNTLKATNNHPVLVRKTYQDKYYLTYVQVGRLKVGDVIVEMHTNPYEDHRGNLAGYIIPIEYLNFSEIKEINELEAEDVFDIEVEGSHNFIADGIVVHNSNFETARMIFWEDTVVSYLNIIKEELNNWIFGVDNPEKLFLDFDLEKIPALSIKRERLWERMQKSDFLTINEKRRILGMDDLDGSDVILVPLNYTILQPGPVLTPVLGKTQNADIEDDGELNNSQPEKEPSDGDDSE